MTHLPFDNPTSLKCRALYVGERLDLRAFEKTLRIASNPLVVTAGAQGCAVLFRYGVAVLFGLSSVEEVDFLHSLASHVREAFPEPESEEVLLLIDPAGSEWVEEPDLVLNALTVELLQLVAEVLAKSVVLSHYELEVSDTFRLIEPLAENLKKKGRGGSRGRQLLRHIGDTLSIQGRMVGRVEITEKPDLLWNHPEHQRLYDRLDDEYELSERHLALERKLELIARTAETLLGLLHNSRSLRVEWYITLLIVFEILITLYEMFA